MKMMKKLICLALIIAMTLVMIPLVSAEKDGSGLSDFTEYYGRTALEEMPNSTALLYAYDNIVEGVENSRVEISVFNGKDYLSVRELEMVFEAYLGDYAHHFWVASNYRYSYNSRTAISILPRYLMSGETLEKAKADFLKAAEEILSFVDESMTEYEKELIIHDRLVERVTYDISAPNAFDSYGALVDGRTVCEGYAEAFQYLLHRAGIKAVLITGSSNGVGHEWNLVMIDGEYYHVDPTWNDQGEITYHAYFNMSDRMIKEDHRINYPEYPMPECSSEGAHYFNVSGDSVEEGEYSVESIAALLKKSHPLAHVYVNGDVETFLLWYYANIRAIAYEAGVTGGFLYGYSYLGREVVLKLDGEYPPEIEETVISGDVDGDEGVTNSDVLLIYRYIYDPVAYPIDEAAADVDGDGFVTNSDVLLIYRYIYDPETYPLGE